MRTRILPSEKTERQRRAFESLLIDGEVVVGEPCNCGSRITHNNGGNYHRWWEFKMDSGKLFWRWGTTYEYDEPSQWEEMEFGTAIAKVAELVAEHG